MKNKIIFFTIITSTHILFSAESLSTKIHNQYQSFRALGMGNAFTTVVDDSAALMYNPAVLAKRKRGEIQSTLVGFGVSSQTTKLMKDISDAEKSTTDPNQKATAISNALDSYYGKPLGGRVHALEFFWTRPNWAVALIPVDLSLDMSVNRQLGPAIDLNIKKDTTLAYAYGQDILETLSIGVLGKIIHRDSVEQSLSAIELAQNSNLISKERFNEGLNVEFEVGFLWRPEFMQRVIPKKGTAPNARNPQSDDTSKATSAPLSADTTTAEKIETEQTPTAVTTDTDTMTEIENPLSASLVVRNLFNSGFSKSKLLNKDATTAPSKNRSVFDLGVGYDLTAFNDMKLRLTAEAKNIFHPNTTFRKSTHAGFELDYSPSSWFKTQFRAGINQMYFTAGLTLLLGVVEIDAVTYGEEVGTTTTQIENRVNAIKLGFNF